MASVLEHENFIPPRDLRLQRLCRGKPAGMNLGQTGNLAILCGFVTAVLKLES
jgi:hypothetical protein